MSNWDSALSDALSRKTISRRVAIDNEQIFRTESIEDTYRFDFFNRATIAGESILVSSMNVSSGLSDITDYLLPNFTVVMTEKDQILAYSRKPEDMVYVTAQKANHTVRLSIFHTPGNTAIVEDVRGKLEFNPCFVEYVYDPQYLESITVPVDHEKLPISEMYPFLGSDLHDYYNRFMESKSNILLLIGNPGTGKTSMVRGMLAHTQCSATLAYHEKIIEQDAFFVDWIRSDKTFMVLEDSDNLLLPREEGNNLMSRFLNLGDGLMKFEGKKMIFTTNLTDVSKIDTALTRPGRCFDIVHFRDLTREEANHVADKCGVNRTDREKISLSELFAGGFIKKKQNFGFL